MASVLLPGAQVQSLIWEVRSHIKLLRPEKKRRKEGRKEEGRKERKKERNKGRKGGKEGGGKEGGRKEEERDQIWTLPPGSPHLVGGDGEEEGRP